MPSPRNSNSDTLPCQHALETGDVANTRALLETLAEEAPQLLREHSIEVNDWDALLRAAVEQIRGSNAATMKHKKRFVEEILKYGVEAGVFESTSFVGTENRQDYRVDLPDGTAVCIEAKGCPDGNNTTIWDRPSWADEFIVWCLCPDSLVKQPGEGAWSGIATRLLPKTVADGVIVDAMMFWDGRCGSSSRQCPKGHGIHGELRAKATDIPGDGGKRWLPPPCVYLFPRTKTHVRSNPNPPVHTVKSCKFANAILALFNVPETKRPSYVHEAHVQAQGSKDGTTRIKPLVISRCWDDGEQREVGNRWKPLRRE